MGIFDDVDVTKFAIDAATILEIKADGRVAILINSN